MEELSELVRQFYGGQLTGHEHEQVHRDLVLRLPQESTLKIALDVLRWTGSPRVDDAVVYYAAAVVDDTARRRFDKMSAKDRVMILEATIARLLAEPAPQLPFVTMKIVRSLTHLAQRDYLSHMPQSAQPFLVSVLHYACQTPKHDAPAPPHYSPAIQILTTLAIDLPSTHRTDLLTAHRAQLSAFLVSHAHVLIPVFVTAFSAPHPTLVHVAPNAARAIYALTTLPNHPLEPQHLAEALGSLHRECAGTDETIAIASLECLVEAAESPRAAAYACSMETVASLLSGLTNGARSHDVACMVLTYAETVLRRRVTLCLGDPQLEGQLDAVFVQLGKVTSVASRQPGAHQLFLRSLEVWITAVSQTQRAVGTGNKTAQATANRLQAGLKSIIEVCLQQMLLATNELVLASLEYWDERLEQEQILMTETDLALLTNDLLSDEVERVRSERAVFRERCTQLTADVCRLYGDRVASLVADFICSRVGSSLPEEDRITLLTLAVEVSPSLMPESDALRRLLDVVVRFGLADESATVADVTFPVISSMVHGLLALPAGTADSVLMAIAAKAVDLVGERSSSARTKVAAASTLALLVDKRRTGIFGSGAGLNPSYIVCCSQPRAARDLLVAVMRACLLTGHSLDSGKLSMEEWRGRADKFSSFVIEVLRPLYSATKAVELGDLSETHCDAIMRGTGLLQALFEDSKPEKATPKEALWASCGGHVEHVVSNTLPATLANGLVATAAAVIRMLEVVFESTRHKAGELPKQVIESVLNLPMVLSKPRPDAPEIVRSLLGFVRAELATGAPTDKEWLVQPTTNLCEMYRNFDPEISAYVLKVVQCCLVRHWRWFFPEDSALSILQNSPHAINSLNGHPEEFSRLLSIAAEMLSSPEVVVYQGAVEVLIEVDKSRKLFSRPIFRHCGAMEVSLGNIFRSLCSRTHDTVRDRAIVAVHGIANREESEFVQRVLPRILSSVANLSQEQIVNLCQTFPTEKDLNSFNRGLEAMLNDVAYYRRLSDPSSSL